MRIGRFSGALPLVLMTVLIVAVGAFATVRQDAFLTSFNLNNLLLLTMPLAFVSLGQTCALLVGGFDVSVAALMTFCVVVASYTMSFDTSGWALLPGALALIAVGLGDRASSTPSIDPRPQASVDHRDARDVQHPRRCLAPPPGSPRRPHLERRHRAVSRRASASFRSPSSPSWSLPCSPTCGCTARVRASPCGRSASTRRRRAGSGWRPGASSFLAFVICSVMASLAGFYLAAQVQIGSPLIGNFGLESIAAAVLGGAALSGGRGSFVGALLAALFLSLIDNVLPLFHQPTEYSADDHRRADPAGARALPGPRASRPPANQPGGVGRLQSRRGRSAGRLSAASPRPGAAATPSSSADPPRGR